MAFCPHTVGSLPISLFELLCWCLLALPPAPRNASSFLILRGALQLHRRGHCSRGQLTGPITSSLTPQSRSEVTSFCSQPTVLNPQGQRGRGVPAHALSGEHSPWEALHQVFASLTCVFSSEQADLYAEVYVLTAFYICPERTFALFRELHVSLVVVVSAANSETLTQCGFLPRNFHESSDHL